MRILQYIAYFPPHVGGLESHAAEWTKWRVSSGFGSVLVATYAVGQGDALTYEVDGYTVVCIPAFEIIPTFPFPKFRKKSYWDAQKIIKSFNTDILITRTRFFIPSLIGGILAKLRGKKRVHIEHGVDYVVLDARWKNHFARLFDQIIGRWIFIYADAVVAISAGCKRFVQKFTSRNMPVIYRGVDSSLQPNKIPEHIPVFKFGYVGRLVKLKGVDTILYACKKLLDEGITSFTLSIVGDGEEKLGLMQLHKELALENNVIFSGFKDKLYLEKEFYPDMHGIINASIQEGLPTGVIEGLLAQCVVVATNVGGTPEISDQDDLILVVPGEVNALVLGLKKAMLLYENIAGRSRLQVLQKFDRSQNITVYKNFFDSF